MSSQNELYRWRGTDRRGAPRAGTMTLTADQLAAEIGQRWRAGWRELAVCRGDGPVPPRRGEEGQVGGIGPDPGTGRRIWWSELARAAALR